MVVVGYDDNLASFRIFNSWGPKWGKNGMIWVKYNEFAKYCKYAYIIYVGQNKPIQTSASQTIKSSPVVASSNETLTEGNLNELPLRDISGKFYFYDLPANLILIVNLFLKRQRSWVKRIFILCPTDYGKLEKNFNYR